MKRYIFLLIFSSVFLVTYVFADEESLEGSLQNLYEDVAKGYTNPIITGFGTSLNGGWFHSAPRSTVLGLDLEYGLVLMGSFFPAGESTFEAKGNIQFGRNDCETITSFLVGDSLEFIRDYLIESIMAQDIQVEIFGPTIIGASEDSIQIIFPKQDFIIIIPEEGEITVTVPEVIIGIPVGGLLEDLPFLPFFTQQLSIGTIYGTRFVFRFLPSSGSEDDIGEFSYFGFGIQHNPNSWLKKELPFNISASLFGQTLKIGSILTVEAAAFGINVSKTYGYKMLSFTPYGGLMLENCITKLKYDLHYENLEGIPEVHK
ncbi:MAG: hypothetical protein KAW88_07855, partial [Candidatus Cloacimonetes bacterium]|nr:hypothetical protein [Candidatus Cloacimonadota bacterium]